MSSQPAKEWYEMSEKRRNEIVWQASVLAEIRDCKATIDAHRIACSRDDMWTKLVRKDA